MSQKLSILLEEEKSCETATVLVAQKVVNVGFLVRDSRGRWETIQWSHKHLDYQHMDL